MEIEERTAPMAHLLQHLLEDGAERHPARVAVADGDTLLTYEQLDRLSNRLARALGRRGVVRGDRVGVLIPKSAGALVAIYAALKAGACYVPLDAGSPEERLDLILRDSSIGVLVADPQTAPRAAELAARLPGPCLVITVDVQGRGRAPAPQPQPRAPAAPVGWEDVLAEGDGPLTVAGVIDTDLAYLLYTSGSTGVPKGVMISHRASLTFVEWATACVGLGEQDRVCSPAPLHFDLSVFDIFASCRAGACAVVLPPLTSMFPVRLAEWLQDQRISVWYSVPSLLTMLATRGRLSTRDLTCLHTVIFAGEVFPAKHLSNLMEQLPHARYLNWYGPTETNVCTWYDVPRGAGAPSAPVPIGRACTNVDVFALTADGREASAAGDEGELFVRGSGLMSGYWRQPEKTNDALVRNPLQGVYEERVYRTGDMVSLDGEGNYVFLGRRDGMVKTRGYRVEVGEVETALYGHPAVREAVVVPVPDDQMGNRLRAVVSIDGEADPTRDDLLEHCRRLLPGYMVPDVIEFREALPKTSTGKVDRVGVAGS